MIQKKKYQKVYLIIYLFISNLLEYMYDNRSLMYEYLYLSLSLFLTFPWCCDVAARFYFSRIVFSCHSFPLIFFLYKLELKPEIFFLRLVFFLNANSFLPYSPSKRWLRPLLVSLSVLPQKAAPPPVHNPVLFVFSLPIRSCNKFL